MSSTLITTVQLCDNDCGRKVQVYPSEARIAVKLKRPQFVCEQCIEDIRRYGLAKISRRYWPHTEAVK